MKPAVLALIGMQLCSCQTPAKKVRSSNSMSPVPSREDAFIRRENNKIEKHMKLLADEGRMPVDFWSPYIVLGQYGWHTSSESSVGSRPAIAMLQRSSGGAFGAYSFYQPAFEQAKKSWWIHAVMRKGSDILEAANRNARLKGGELKWASSDGQEERYPPMNDMVGYKVRAPYFLGEGQATVIEVIDGSKVRLDRKALKDAVVYDVGILPPDYVDMCACTMSNKLEDR